MDMEEKIHIELLKSIKIFKETYVSYKSNKNHKKINYNHSPIIYPKNAIFQKFPLDDEEKFSVLSNNNPKYKLYNIICQLKKDHKKRSREKIDSIKKHKHRLSHDLKKMEKTNLNKNIIITPKHHPNNVEKIQLINNFRGKNQIYKNDSYKPQDNTIKLNLVNQKFKIADDFNEKNSNQFLKEKDECLKKLFLTDEIEEEDFIPSYSIIKKERKHKLSCIRKNKYIDGDDSVKSILGLIQGFK